MKIPQTRSRNDQNGALDICGPNVPKHHLEEFEFSNWVYSLKKEYKSNFLGQKYTFEKNILLLF